MRWNREKFPILEWRRRFKSARYGTKWNAREEMGQGMTASWALVIREGIRLPFKAVILERCAKHEEIKEINGLQDCNVLLTSKLEANTLNIRKERERAIYYRHDRSWLTGGSDSQAGFDENIYLHYGLSGVESPWPVGPGKCREMSGNAEWGLREAIVHLRDAVKDLSVLFIMQQTKQGSTLGKLW